MSELHNLFSASEPCLTEEQLLLYMQHQLSPFEQHQVEKHLLDCELCTDALEGLRMSKSQEQLKEKLALLNQQIDIRVKQSGKKVVYMYPWMRMAALVVLVAISAATFMYLQKEQKQQEQIVAENKTEFPPTPPNNFELKQAEPSLAEQPKEIAAKEFKTPVASAIRSKNAETVAHTSKSNEVVTETIAAVSEENKESESAPTSVARQPMPQAVQESKRQVATESAGATHQAYDAVADNAKKKVMTGDKIQMESLLMNSAVIITNAKNQMQNNHFDSANFLLDEVINHNDTRFLEEALWNKSIALENMNRTTDAKNVLQKIVTMNGKYKKKATDKLKKW